MLPPDADEELHDAALEQEIELLADLIDAVASAGHPLCQAEVDLALGLAVPATERVARVGSVTAIGNRGHHRRGRAT